MSPIWLATQYMLSIDKDDLVITSLFSPPILLRSILFTSDSRACPLIDQQSP